MGVLELARPRRCRRIASLPNFAFFKPAGVAGRALQEVGIAVDEYEALRPAVSNHLGWSRVSEGLP